MSLDDLRKRLEQLNRGPIDAIFKRASKLPAKTPPDRSPRLPTGLESLIPGSSRDVDGATFYSIERLISTQWEPGTRIVERFFQAMSADAADDRADSAHEALADALASGLANLLFVDLETCGFAGTPVFLIGTMYAHQEDLRVEQLLARTYAEETAIVARFSRLLDGHSHLVTFNGKSFDWPFLADRAAICRVPLRLPSGHCDLLHVARRRFGEILPDCKLQTLEQHLCGRRRIGDIPGGSIPAAYHDFVRTGDARRLRDILRHNFLDLATMAEILAGLLRA